VTRIVLKCWLVLLLTTYVVGGTGLVIHLAR
jgi:hypothetical protein